MFLKTFFICIIIKNCGVFFCLTCLKILCHISSCYCLFQFSVILDNYEQIVNSLSSPLYLIINSQRLWFVVLQHCLNFRENPSIHPSSANSYLILIRVEGGVLESIRAVSLDIIIHRSSSSVCLSTAFLNWVTIF